MTGLELSRRYYEQYGKPMIEDEFAPYLDRIAVGLVGHGSECFGFDDGVSRDHDFEPGFCLWIPEEDDALYGFRLFRAYRALPKEFEGIKIEKKSGFGSEGRGVHTIEEFYSFYTGTGKAPQTFAEWLAIPDFYLAEATNGEVFSDPLGRFSEIRAQLLGGMPEDVRLKKLASAIFSAAQSGQYNYGRCLSHGEKIAAAQALGQFVDAVSQAVFLLNRRHAPYYKWRYRAMRQLPRLSDLAERLETLSEFPYRREENTALIESIAGTLIDEIRREGLSEREDDYMEPFAYDITGKIKDGELRNSPVQL